jgi:hypothetical protein
MPGRLRPVVILAPIVVRAPPTAVTFAVAFNGTSLREFGSLSLPHRLDGDRECKSKSLAVRHLMIIGA